MRLIIAWIKKYIFRIKSPMSMVIGYEYEYDFLKTVSDFYKESEEEE